MSDIMTMELTRQIDPKRFREALGHYASGITVISGHDAEGPIGFTCQSFYSVSVDPPLISFSVMKTSTTYPRIREAGLFAVNVLSSAQVEVANQFARRGIDKWVGINWSAADSGNPLLLGTQMWLDCTIWDEHEAGDHLIVVGRVKELSPAEWHNHDPLLYFRGQYRSLA